MQEINEEQSNRQQQQQQNSKPRKWPFFLVGTALGAALGLLFAPKPGEESREELKDWLQEKREQLKNRFAKKEGLGARSDHKGRRSQEEVAA